MFKWETSILRILKDIGADLSNSKIASKVADSNVLPPKMILNDSDIKPSE